MLTACDLPLTLSWIAIFLAASGIDVFDFDLFTSGTTHGNSNCSLHESSHQYAFVIRRAAHVGLRFGSRAGRFHGDRNRLFGNPLATQGRLGVFRFDWR